MKRPDTYVALAAYVALSILLTWPLALGLGRDVPGDLGDSLLNMWILAWGAAHAPQLVTGGVSWAGFWNANIFHPEPLALALSEHLFGQVIQILPVYWLTGNIILCYNLLFVSTFALSGFGTYLLVRDLTGNRLAAFVAGLVYGFLPYRIASVPHLQVMSSQWMPLALYGFNRFVTGPGLSRAADAAGGGRPRHLALAGGTAALVMQNWSCGYYLLYFAPFVPLFAVHRMWTTGSLTSRRAWSALILSATATLLLTLPFLLPYLEAQQRFGIERPFGEVVQFSANVWSYVTASENLRLWGQALRYHPHGEGETFLGFVPWILAAAALIGLVAERRATTAAPRRGARFWVAAVLVAAVIAQFLALASVVIAGGFEVDVLGIPIRARTPQRLLLQFVVAAALLLAVSPRARARANLAVRSPILFFAGAAILAMWLSLGPLPNAGAARVSGLGLYGVLYDYVPGFNGVRVPARYAMIAGLFLAVLAGYGMAALSRVRLLAPGFPFVACVVAILVLAEGAAVPMEVNRTWGQSEATPPARVYPAGQAPPIYARLAALPAGSVITHFPFGDAAWEIRYVYYAAAHWKPITNGYSGGFPPTYKALVARLRDVAVEPEAAWRALLDTRTTHVVVSQAAFADPARADAVRLWLMSHHALVVEQLPDGDTLFALP
jgi:hypothetical protein